MLNKFDELRNLYPEFLYESYHIERTGDICKVIYKFKIPNLCTFSPTWEFPVSDEYNEKVLDRLVFSLGMVELVSYWKCVCSKIVKINCGSLSTEQQKWWQKLYYNGLGEFLYLNEISITEDELITILCDDKIYKPINDLKERVGCLLPIGGGKDSIVSISILEKMQENYATFSVNRIDATEKVISICSTKSDDYLAKRRLSKELVELNEKGYLNGHTPFSAIVAFASVITALLNGKKNVVLSNETSANESTIKNSKINHQYSKSYEFEKDFNWYLDTIANTDIVYFSLLRPLNESQIAKLFSKQKKYYHIFKSCNSGSKQGIWCCNCPKCLFVYIILLPFVNLSELDEIFGENLLNNESLDLYFKQLTGISDNKPFECVGTREEVLASLKDYIKRGYKSILTDKYRIYIEESSYNLEVILSQWANDNDVPFNFQETIRRYLS